MKSRMSKYENIVENPNIKSRVTKNQIIYNDDNILINPTNPEYNVIEIDKNVNLNSLNREEYKKKKEFEKIFSPNNLTKESKTDIKKHNDPKIYDINTIIEKAKRDRLETDDLEAKRSLKENDYNIFKDTSIDELKQRKTLIDKQKNEIQDLINTIGTEDITNNSSSTSDDLLTDLIDDKQNNQTSTTNIESDIKQDNTTLNEYSSKEILAKDDDEDTSFFTKSAELTNKDFTDEEEEDEDENNDYKTSKSHPILRTLLFILLILIVCFGFYLIYKNK